MTTISDSITLTPQSSLYPQKTVYASTQSLEAGITIVADQETTASGYSVPELSVDDVIQAYNAIVANQQCIISSSTGVHFFVVNQADSLNDEISIEIIYYNSALITYTVDNTDVVITVTSLA